MLNVADKVKWTTALRSRQYIQGTRVLRTKENTFCCLGVWCDLKDPSKWVLSAENGIPEYEWDGRFGSLPNDALKELGLSHRQEEMLINMNDQGKTFAEIADYIEKNL